MQREKSKLFKRLVVLVLSLTLVLQVMPQVYGNEASHTSLGVVTTQLAVEELLAYYESQEDLDDWELILALYGANIPLEDNFFEALGWDSDTFPETVSPSFYGSRLLALMAMGQDPTDYFERDLVESLVSKMDDEGLFGTPTDQMYALLALEAAEADYDRLLALEAFLTMQNADGGFGYAVGSSDLDTTGTALMVLGHFMDDATEAIEEAVAYIQERQLPTGGFASWGTENANTTARVISGLVAVDKDPLAPEFVQSGNTMWTALSVFQLADGSFTWQLEPATSNPFSSKQVLLALGDLTASRSATKRLAGLPYTFTVTLRIEGATETVLNTSVTLEYNEADLSLKDFLTSVLDNNEVPYEIAESSFGAYLVSIGDDASGAHGGYEGWLYQLNGSGGNGLDVDRVGHKDSLLFYYGLFGSDTLVPKAHVIDAVLVSGETLKIHVMATYDAYDANWQAVPTTVPVVGAIVRFNNQDFITDSKGFVRIGHESILWDALNTYQIIEPEHAGVPSLVRSEVKTVSITLDNEKLYKDDNQMSDWSRESIYGVRQSGLMIGNENQFSPKTAMTQSELIALLVRLMGHTVEAQSGATWYEGYIEAALEAEIIMAGLTITPNAPISRGEFATMLAYALKLEAGPSEATFNDMDDLDITAASAILAVYEAGLMIGYDADTFGVDDPLSREMVAVIATRIQALVR